MDSDLPCQNMDTDLYIAAKTGDTDYLQKPHGPRVFAAKPHPRNAMLFTLLLISSAQALLKLFKNAEQALEMKNERADTALHVAVRNGHLEVVKPLVQENSMLLDLGTKGMTALHAAVIRTHKGPELGKPIPELSVNGLGLHLRGVWFSRNTIQCQEVPELSLEKLRRVVTNFFFRVRGHFKGKQLNDEIDIMEVLFEMKKDVIKKADEFGWTPLHYAAHLGHLEATEKLLTKEGHTNVMEQIITCLPDVYDLIDNKGRTILHVAAQYGNARVVKYILKKPNLESIINEPDKEGNTPLHLAAIYGHYGVVIMLAADDRVDKRAMNNEYLKTIDIVQSNMDIGEIIKYWIMRKLEHAGGRQVYTGTENHEEKQLRSHRLKDISNTHLLVATLIATVTFAAGFTLPGGTMMKAPTKQCFSTFLLHWNEAIICFYFLRAFNLCICAWVSVPDLLHLWGSVEVAV
ncbi:Protein accelerated cell death 6 [Vitis vinifera]|uniref:Protein accelerated cell death 6 n=1 Tax=Vitis vinifera TaxID=29760 RepID=A0A438GZP5_VITVI|nr:Protein accelerated cell death 6 [Vitis vinifera]